MRKFLAAVGFLTALPVRGEGASNAGELGGSVPYFVPVGLLLGVSLAGMDYALLTFLQPLPAAVATVIAMAAVSGALHMDGLADTADGFLSGAPAERALEIMRDSRTGPMGALALFSVFALKVAALASVAPASRWIAVLLAVLAGRCAMVIALSLAPYARKSGGLGTAFTGKPYTPTAVWGALFPLAAGLCFWPGGVAVWTVAIVTTFYFMHYCVGRIGGMTGDTYGALCEIVEAVSLLTASVFFVVAVI